MGKALSVIGLILFSLVSSAAVADELRIIDVHGLTRAVRRTRAAVEVEVKVKAEPKGGVTMSNVDGVAPDVEATRKEGRYHFQDLKEGTWRLNIEPDLLAEVRIKD